MSNKTSQYILNSSTNLLGFCLFVITSFHIANFSEASIVDELTAVIAILLIFSCLLSFVSIRTENKTLEKKLEKYANQFFLSALLGLFIIITLIAFRFIK